MRYEILNFHRHSGAGTLLATADICFEGSVTICDAKLVERKSDRHIFLALPTRKIGETYRADALIIDKVLRAEIEKSFLAQLQNEQEAKSS